MALQSTSVRKVLKTKVCQYVRIEEAHLKAPCHRIYNQMVVLLCEHDCGFAKHSGAKTVFRMFHTEMVSLLEMKQVKHSIEYRGSLRHTCVYTQMSCYISSMRKLLSADITAEWFFA